jgi:hypothetical protein
MTVNCLYSIAALLNIILVSVLHYFINLIADAYNCRVVRCTAKSHDLVRNLRPIWSNSKRLTSF